MTSALAWLEPRPLAPLTFAAGERGLAGFRHDGLVAQTPEHELAAVDLLAGPEGRAATLREVVPQGAAVARAAAVWVHTGRVRPRRTDVVVEPHRRVQAAAVVHRQHLPPGDVMRVGGVPTTTPLRTAVDLLCYGEEATAVAGARALLAHGLAVSALRAALNGLGRRRPSRRAQGLLEQALSRRPP